MKKECIYAADTPYGCCCTLVCKECSDPFTEDCDEPEWFYLKQLVEEYEEDDTGTI